MAKRAWVDPGPAPPLGESRARVLEVLRAAGDPVGVQEIAERTGLHPNTARFHLDGLIGAGLGTRRSACLRARCRGVFGPVPSGTLHETQLGRTWVLQAA